MTAKDWRMIARAFFETTGGVATGDQTDTPDDVLFDKWWNYERHKGVSPHPLFDTNFYLSQIGSDNLPLKDAFLHFIEHGANASCDPHPCFSMEWYRRKYLKDITIHPWIHYVQNTAGNTTPNWLFAQETAKHYSSSNYKTDALTQFLRSEVAAKLSPHPLLDRDFILKYNPQIDPENFYISFWTEYRRREIRTHLFFDPKYYLNQLSRQPAINCLADYIIYGEIENLKPHPLFWPQFYANQSRLASKSESLLEEYAASGERLSVHPCPGFDPGYYLSTHLDVARAGLSPLAHFIGAGQKALRRPHRRFEIAWYSLKLAEDERNQALEHFLSKGASGKLSPHPALNDTGKFLGAESLLQYLTPEPKKTDLLEGLDTPLSMICDDGFCAASPNIVGQAYIIEKFECAVENATKIDADLLKRNEPIARQISRFDEVQSAEFSDRLTFEFDSSGLPTPLVSVIMPTRNRARVLKRAISSVLSQTYDNFELIIVDDGSTDGTADLIRLHFSDVRIRYEPRHALGVSAARNAGLTAARGDFMAYLDSDNYWEPRHIELIVKSLLMSGRRCAYDALRAFNEKGQVKYRGDVYCRDALDRENYIDMNVFIHDSAFRNNNNMQFDEDLKRCVDWDFILRCAHISEPLYVPVIGCNYVDESHELERITTSELSGDFYKVSIRNLNVERHISGTDFDATPVFSIIWPIEATDWNTSKYEIWKILNFISKNCCELIIINNCLQAEATNYLDAIARFARGIKVVHLWRTFIVFPAFNLGAKIARGEWLVLWSSSACFEDLAFRNYIDTHCDYDSEIVFPLVKDEEGIIINEVATVELSSVVLHPALTGRKGIPDHGRVYGLVPVRSIFSVKRHIFIERDGFSSKFANRYGLADFALSQLWENPKSTVIELAAVFASIKNFPEAHYAEERKELELFQETWLGRLHVEPCLPPSFTLHRHRYQNYVNIDWKLRIPPSDGMSISGPTVRRPILIAIRCPAPSDESKNAWGDYHFAQCMGKALSKIGVAVRIELRDDWDADVPVADIYIHLRGIIDVRPVKSALNVIWVISHPEKINVQEYGSMDLIFVAGPTIKKQLWTEFGLQSQLLLQATDSSRFGIEGRKTVDAVVGKALFVGNSRMQPRAIVSDAARHGLPLRVYGRDWNAFIAPGFVAGDYIPNAELGDWYHSAAVVLNDHWVGMRKFGILSNRLFDAVACGSPVITDEIAGISEIFGEAVRSYNSADKLGDLFHELSGRRFNEEAAYIASDHTFDARMAELLRHLA